MSSSSSLTPFKKGDTVEVKLESNQNDSNSKSNIVTWYSATVLKATEGTKGKLFVQFTNLTSYENAHLRERVDFCRVRPLPPPARWWFKIGNRVEVFYEYGWRRGFVLEILEDSKYLVKVDGVAEVSHEVDQWRVRMFQDWIDGSWISDESPQPPDQVNVNSDDNTAQVLQTVPKKLVVKFEGKRKELKLTKKFNVGTRVEVSSDEVGYEGAYYAANVVGYLTNCKYLIEYLTLRTSDEKEALREEAECRHVRPCPPCTTRVESYKLFETVDCWYNDGWWEGEVSKVLPRRKYYVYFSSTMENLVFGHSDLRPHWEWVDGRWYTASTSKEQNDQTHPALLEENGRAATRQ